MNDCGNMLKEGFHKLPWVPLENEIYISHIMHISYIYAQVRNGYLATCQH